MKHKRIIFIGLLIGTFIATAVFADYRFSDFQGRAPLRSKGQISVSPLGLTPDQVKAAYNLPKTGGHGTIAIIDVGSADTIENDLAVFSKQFGLPSCTVSNKCFEKHVMDPNTSDQGWGLETALDVEWAHAIAPQAKVLLIQAKTASGTNLMNAVDYARSRSDVVSISMSWGGDESADEIKYDSHFVSPYGAVFFASSGDEGAGPEWPAASPNVVAVGGTHLNFSKDGKLLSETAWTGSGGGISKYEPAPSYQTSFSIPKAKGKRSIPDVSFNADPDSGYSVYKGGSRAGWQTIGGTSAGAPQWAAIQSLGLTANNKNFYRDKASANDKTFFRDIKTGTNGACGYYCTTRNAYDYVTGLGSPLTIHF